MQTYTRGCKLSIDAKKQKLIFYKFKKVEKILICNVHIIWQISNVVILRRSRRISSQSIERGAWLRKCLGGTSEVHYGSGREPTCAILPYFRERCEERRREIASGGTSEVHCGFGRETTCAILTYFRERCGERRRENASGGTSEVHCGFGRKTTCAILPCFRERCGRQRRENAPADTSEVHFGFGREPTCAILPYFRERCGERRSI